MTPFQLDASVNAPWTRTTVSGAVWRVVLTYEFPCLVGVDVDNGLGERFRGFLGKVVSDAAIDCSV